MLFQEVRRVFQGKMDTTTESDGSIKAFIPKHGASNARNSHNQHNRPQQNQMPEQRGKFLHFTLYKENRDTMEAISAIAFNLKSKPQLFGTAGTKDRRAVTVQRVSVRGRTPQSLLSVNNGRIPGVRIGDFKFEEKALYLGCHQGNEFTIVLKNCWFSGTETLPMNQRLEIAKSTVGSALTQLVQHGFLNYFGTQRFGTFEIGTQEIGIKILKGDFEGAVKSLLAFDPAHLQVIPDGQHQFRRDDVNRAHGCSTFLETGNLQDALKCLPSRCRAERELMRHLSRAPNDFLGALQTIPRTMRTMYVHAYQSLVWNFVASKRWEQYGNQVVRGDLVLVNSDTTEGGNEDAAELDEETLHLAERDSTDKRSELKVRALVDDDVSSGKYSVFDIVLPTPGWDVMYPDNDIGQFYIEFMGRPENGGLDPHSMQRRHRDFSLPGSYRSLMGKVTRTPSLAVRHYADDTEQLVSTDLDIINSRKAQEAAESRAKTEELQAQASGWQTFTENVEEVERAEAMAEHERRKAEGPHEIPDAQISDTWVQTGLDGSHKRIKVARHEVETSNSVDHMQPDTDTLNGQASSTQKFIGVDPNSIGGDGNKQNGGTPAAPPASDETSDEIKIVGAGGHDGVIIETGRSIPSFTTQVRELIVALFKWLWATLTTATDNSDAKKTSNCPPPQTSTTVDSSEPTHPNDSAPDEQPEPKTNESKTDEVDKTDEMISNDIVNDETAVWTEFKLAKQTTPPATSDATNATKIAVILRFALDTSQYATMVLRELQGASSE